MNKIAEAGREYFENIDEAVITTRRVIFLEVFAGFLGGIVLGMLIAPPRRVKMGCNNGNNNSAKYGSRKK